MDEYIRFTCSNPSCGKRLKAPPEHAGRRSRCSCGERVTVPCPEPLPPAGPVPASPPATTETSAPPPSPAASGSDDRHVDWGTSLFGAATVFAIAWLIFSLAFGAFAEDVPGEKAQWTPNKVRGMVLALFAASLPAVGLMWGYVAAARRWTRPRVNRGLKIAGGSFVGLMVCLLVVGVVMNKVREGQHRQAGAELAPAFTAHLPEYTTELQDRLLKDRTVNYHEIGGYYRGKDPELAIPGKVVVVNLSGPKIDPLVFGGLKPELRAATPEEVKTVIWLNYRPDQRGQYADGRPRVVILCDVTVLGKAGPTALRRITFEGSVPGETIQGWESATGRPPGEEIIDYLNHRLKIR